MKTTIRLSALAGLVFTVQIAIANTVTEDSAFTIKGYLPEQKTGKIYLHYGRGKESVKDSALLENGRFRFSGSIATPTKASIYSGNMRDYQSKDFYLEPGKTQVVSYRTLSDAMILGGETQALFQLQNKMNESFQQRFNDMFSRRYLNSSNPDSVFILTMALRNLSKQRAKDNLEFIKRFPDSYISWNIVKDETIAINPDILEPELNALSPTFRNSAEGKEIAEKLTIAKRSWIGSTAPGFSQPDVNGKKVTLESFRGQYVLVDFWASWCGPCRLENPHVLKAYDAFKSKGFTVLGVSLDDKKDKWVKAIEQDKMPWMQLSDLSGWKNEVAVTYGIKAIPQNFLVDPKGVIVAKNLRGDDLMVTLQEIIDGKK